jgi:hypothetical protein
LKKNILIALYTLTIFFVLAGCFGKGEAPAAKQKKLAETAIEAIEFDNLKLMKEAIEKGLDPDARFNDEPLITRATRETRPAIVKMLLENGADVATPDFMGNPLIIWPIRVGKPEIVSLLLEKGVDPNTRDIEGCPALVWAKRVIGLWGKEMTEILLENRADPNVVDSR